MVEVKLRRQGTDLKTTQHTWLPHELQRLKDIAQQLQSERSGTPLSKEPATTPAKREDKGGH